MAPPKINKNEMKWLELTEMNRFKLEICPNIGQTTEFKCGENRNHGKFKIYFLMVEL